MKLVVCAVLFRKNGNIVTFLSLSKKAEIPVVVNDEQLLKLKRGGIYKLKKEDDGYQVII